ncbi:MAG: glycosyl transferase, partial [Anaerolineae bacterium]|nr:glycosyl transferase [Anaerolineae bacterium]
VKELVERGHTVLYYNTEEFRPQIERAGAHFRPYPPPMPTVAETQTIISENLVQVTRLILSLSGRLTGHMLSELDHERPDLVMYDSICLWGMQSARLAGIPSVASITTFVTEGAGYLFPKRDMLRMIVKAIPVLPEIIRLRKGLVEQYGKDSLPQVLFPGTGKLNLVFTSRAFQPDTPFIDDSFRFVGPAINPATRAESFPFEQLTRKPVVYISLGTIHSGGSFDFYQQCFEAFADHPGQFILSVGKHTDLSQLPTIPANFIVRSSVPQLDVLQQADLFITHGGMNSVQEGLYYGVPLVVIPQQMEQAANAILVERKGAGIVLGKHAPYGRVSTQQLREAADKVLGTPRYAQAAEAVGRSFREAGGYARAVNEIESLIDIEEPTKDGGRSLHIAVQ